MPVVRGDKEITILARQGTQGRGVRIEQRSQNRREGRFRRSVSPESTITGYGPRLRSAASTKATTSTKSASEWTLRKDRSFSTDPPVTGIGKGFIPAARRKRAGDLSITRQPSVSISTARQVVSQRSR